MWRPWDLQSSGTCSAKREGATRAHPEKRKMKAKKCFRSSRGLIRATRLYALPPAAFGAPPPFINPVSAPEVPRCLLANSSQKRARVWLRQTRGGAAYCNLTSLVPRQSASRARTAYVTFEPLSDSWQKAWYHSYVIYKLSGHGCDVE